MIYESRDIDDPSEPSARAQQTRINSYELKIVIYFNLSEFRSIFGWIFLDSQMDPHRLRYEMHYIFITFG